jgi:hypothetical protein
MTISFVQRELDRIHNALGDERTNPKYPELYAAQQALAWALDPRCARSPFDTVMGTQEAKEDCPEYPHPVPFSGTRDPLRISE